jgi:diguanylate cyclase (GGDEF)-like protein/PAS domain S-box-containing protein
MSHQTSELRYRQIIDQLTDGVYFVDRSRTITFWSKGATRITGYGADDVVGRCCHNNVLCHVDDAGRDLCATSCPLSQSIHDGMQHCIDAYLRHRYGHRIPVSVSSTPMLDDDGEIIGAVETFTDMSARLAEMERIRELEAVAFIDPLTRIFNRRYILSILDARLAELERFGWPFGVLLFDVDHFKQFNDTHGHELGDRVLQTVSETLTRSCRRHDTAGRWGGEEFIIVAANVSPAQLACVAERTRALVEASTLQVDDSELSVTISGGGALARAGESSDDVIRRADALLYRSKDSGRNRITLDEMPTVDERDAA